jgi:hypothetical protein
MNDGMTARRMILPLLAGLVLTISPSTASAEGVLLISSNGNAAAALVAANGSLSNVTSIGPATGFGIDVAHNIAYLAAPSTDSFGDVILPLGLNSLLPAGAERAVTGATGSLLDMTFANGYLWAAESNFVESAVLDQIDPATGAVIRQLDLGFDNIPQIPAAGAVYPGGAQLTIPFMSLGVAWDGSGFWISDNPISLDAMGAGLLGTSIQKYVLDSNGNLAPVAGSAFVPFASTWEFADPVDPPAGLAVDDPGRTPGGLAWYQSGLLIGTDSGDIYLHDFTTNTDTLFANTGDAGFVGGLEFAPVPEPSAALLLGAMAASWLVALRRKRR